MAYKLGSTSRKNLIGVHPLLVRCVELAIDTTKQDFTVYEGLRSLSRQKKLLAQGYTRTLKSKHLRQSDGYGHAVDLVPWVNGKAVWEWPLIYPIRDAMKDAARRLGLQDRIEWGGDWVNFKDGPHWQINS